MAENRKETLQKEAQSANNPLAIRAVLDRIAQLTNKEVINSLNDDDCMTALFALEKNTSFNTLNFISDINKLKTDLEAKKNYIKTVNKLKEYIPQTNPMIANNFTTNNTNTDIINKLSAITEQVTSTRWIKFTTSEDFILETGNPSLAKDIKNYFDQNKIKATVVKGTVYINSKAINLENLNIGPIQRQEKEISFYI